MVSAETLANFRQKASLVHTLSLLLIPGAVFATAIINWVTATGYPYHYLVPLLLGYMGYTHVLDRWQQASEKALQIFFGRIMLDLVFIIVASGLTGGFYSGFVFLLIMNLLSALFVLPIRLTLFHGICVILAIPLLRIFHNDGVQAMLHLPSIIYHPIIQNYGHFITRQILFLASTLFSFYLTFFLLRQLQTEKKQIQKLSDELKIKVEELDFKNANLDRFNHWISHDLKNPLSSIKLMAESLSDLEDPRRMDEVRIIQNSAETMHRMIDDLFTLSRLSKDQIQFDQIRLNDVVEIALNECRFDIHSKRARVEIKALPKLFICKIWMIELVKNLITNALKYNVTEPPTIEIGPLKDQNGFYVQDNGIGIPKEYQTELFHIFFRAPNALGISGTGMGLYLVKQVMDIHKGYIELDSEVGKGTRFNLVFP